MWYGIIHILLVLIWVYIYLNKHRECNKLRGEMIIARFETETLKSFILKDAIPTMEEYNPSSDDSSVLEESRRILWESYGIDYWGANYFWLEGYLLGIDKRNSGKMKFSVLYLMENVEFLTKVDALKDLFRDRNLIMKNPYSKPSSLSYLDFQIDNILFASGIKVIGNIPSRVKNYPKKRFMELEL